MSRAEVWAVRHGRTLAAPGLLVGRLEVALAGEPAAVAAAIVVRLATAAPLAEIWSSPLRRCQDSAARVAAALDLPHRIDERLLEIDHGAWAGRAPDAIAAATPDDWTRWTTRWEHEGPPGGESAAAVTGRVRAWLAERRGRVALVAHAGVVRALRVIVDAVPWPAAMAEPVPFADEAGEAQVFRVD